MIKGKQTQLHGQQTAGRARLPAYYTLAALLPLQASLDPLAPSGLCAVLVDFLLIVLLRVSWNAPTNFQARQGGASSLSKQFKLEKRKRVCIHVFETRNKCFFSSPLDT